MIVSIVGIMSRMTLVSVAGSVSFVGNVVVSIEKLTVSSLFALVEGIGMMTLEVLLSVGIILEGTFVTETVEEVSFFVVVVELLDFAEFVLEMNNFLAFFERYCCFMGNLRLFTLW